MKYKYKQLQCLQVRSTIEYTDYLRRDNKLSTISFKPGLYCE